MPTSFPALSAVLLWGFCLSHVAAGEENAAEEFLEDKGLRRFSSCFWLPEEGELGRKLRAAEELKRAAFDARQEVEEARKVVDEKQKLMLSYLQKRRELRGQLPLARTVEQNNRIVLALNELADRIVIMQQSDTEEKALDDARAAASTAIERYTEEVLQLRRLYDEVSSRYETLAADAEVAAAIQQYGDDTGKEYRLGPTASLASHRRRLERLEEAVLTEAVELRRGPGGLWYVTAMFNGKFPQEIAIDTGASVVALPWETAQKVGLTPGADDPSLQVQVADGRVLEAKQVVADSVRVGRFTAEDVACAVLPQGMPGATPLLGLSFLGNFSFKIDSGNGQLLMAQLDTSEQGGRSRSARASAPTEPAEAVGAAASEGSQTPVPQPQPSQPADAADPLVRLLTPKGEQGGETRGVELPVGPGRTAVFRPCVRGPAETLRKRFGPPAQITRYRFERPSPDGGPAATFDWQLWDWGRVKVFVDEGGKTRYFSATPD